MKNTHITIKALVLLLIGVLTSCNDFLDQNPDKRAQLDSKEKIDKILSSAYTQASFALLTELSADNVDDMGDNVHWDEQDEQMFYWKDVDANQQDTPEFFWSGAYGAIANANAALKAINESSNQEELKPEKGEALVARAYAHFALVNVFGKHYNQQTSENDLGVVYMEKSETNLNPKYKRESVASIYKKIERDLEEGLPLIDDKIYNQPKYHFNKLAAYAFAARFYLYYEKWDKAEEYANLVLGASPATVLKNWGELGSGKYEKFEEVPKQYVSSKRIANLLINEMASLRGRKFYFNGKRNIRFHHHLLVANTETIYGTTFYGAGGNNYKIGIFSSVAPYNNTLFFNIPDLFEYADPVAGTGYVRSTEVMFSTDETLLVRAEARIMQQKFDEAAADLDIWAKNFCKVTIPVTVQSINDFYNAMPYYTKEAPTQKKQLHPKFTVATGTQENMIHAVLQARRVLTLYEGLRWFDVKRYGIEIYRRVLQRDGQEIKEIKDKLGVEDPRRALQLPQSVIKAGLEANPR